MGVKTDAIVFLAGGVDAVNSVGSGSVGESLLAHSLPMLGAGVH